MDFLDLCPAGATAGAAEEPRPWGGLSWSPEPGPGWGPGEGGPEMEHFGLQRTGGADAAGTGTEGSRPQGRRSQKMQLTGHILGHQHPPRGPGKRGFSGIQGVSGRRKTRRRGGAGPPVRQSYCFHPAAVPTCLPPDGSAGSPSWSMGTFPWLTSLSNSRRTCLPARPSPANCQVENMPPLKGLAEFRPLEAYEYYSPPSPVVYELVLTIHCEQALCIPAL